MLVRGKAAINEVMDTLTINDYFTVAAFAGKGSILCGTRKVYIDG